MSTEPAHHVRRSLQLTALAVLAYGALLWWLYTEDETFRLAVIRGVVSSCQGTAHAVGSWGLAAEQYYHRLVEAGRTC